MIFKKVLVLGGLFLLFGFQWIPNLKESLHTIDLKQEVNNDINLELSYINYTLSPLEQFPILNKKVKGNYKGLPMNDSISFFANFENGQQFRYDLYKNKELGKDEFLDYIKKRNIDTLQLSPKPLKQGFISVVGFYKNRQFLIADANRNQDFSDDVKYEFNMNFRENPLDSLSILNNLPHTAYSYETYNKGVSVTYHRKLILYPTVNESYNKDIEKYNKLAYLSKFRFKDYWKGQAIINNESFEFYYQSFFNSFGAIYIKPKNVDFSKTENVFNQQFRHFTTDTIAIANGYYKIDSINNNISKLYLREIAKNNNNYGTSIGSYLKNYKLKDINGNPFTTGEIVSRNKYTLIDFWSLRCAPCVKMLPILKKTHADFASKFDIISVTTDKDLEAVKKYVDKHKIPWTNAIVSVSSEINKDLPKALPTLVLIDSKGKIIYVGTDENEVLRLIK